MSSSPLPCVVLVNPQLGENIGAAARAMANFGLDNLRLVDPRPPWPNEKAIAFATKAAPILEKARVFKTLQDALADCQGVYATTARPRGMAKEVLSPEGAGLRIFEETSAGRRVALVFGRERWGLTNEEIALAHTLVTAPVDPDYASLNIAQAVLLVAYECYKPRAKTLGQATPERGALKGPGIPVLEEEWASQAETEHFFHRLENSLITKNFFKVPEKQKKLTQKIRALFMRTRLTQPEIGLLHGIIGALTQEKQGHKIGD